MTSTCTESRERRSRPVAPSDQVFVCACAAQGILFSNNDLNFEEEKKREIFIVVFLL
jgi:hypothetical protein